MAMCSSLVAHSRGPQSAIYLETSMFFMIVIIKGTLKLRQDLTADSH